VDAVGAGIGGAYGGGAGGRVVTSGYSATGFAGGDGAVRIIWGPNRSFPSLNTANV
jgi:hypothetical protein